ncbi:MAG: cell division protein ZapA [Paracoccaceae bacterium]|nr:cell division protein ZapA [Paracoccaceae bacterium]
MPEIVVQIAGREFELKCQDGEEEALRRAAACLGAEADTLSDALGRIPESRLLLLAGLMVADKALTLGDDVERRISEAAGDARKRADEAIENLREANGELTRAKVRLADLQAKFDAADQRARQQGGSETELAAIVERMVKRLEAAAEAVRC